MRSFPVLFRALIILLFILVSLELFVRFFYKAGVRFGSDSELGWVRREMGVEKWVAQDGAHKTLVLGDSFVFGEEVSVAQRFDHAMQDKGYRDTIINLGVSGYSTDQELMAARKELNALRAGDTVVLTTFGDDFRGLLSDFFAGRSKPRFRIESEKLILITPRINFMAYIRDRFYLAAAAHKIFRSTSDMRKIFDRDDLEEALKLYDGLLFQYLAPLVEKNVSVLIAFHGKKIIDEDFGSGGGDEADRSLRRLCPQYGFFYLPLDQEMDNPDYRQAKGVHWNAQGHQKFADLLMSACDKSNNQLHLSQKEKPCRNRSKKPN